MRPDEQPDEQFEDVEIFDLPEDNAPNRPEKRAYHDSAVEGLWRKQRRPLNLFLLVSTVVLAVVLLNNVGGPHALSKLLGGLRTNLQGLAPLPATTPTPSSSDERVMAQLRSTTPGPAPTSCPANPQAQASQNTNPPPFTIFGFNGPNASIHLRALKTFKSGNSALSAWGVRLQIQMRVQDPPSIWLHFSSISNRVQNPIFGVEPGSSQQETTISANNGRETGNISPSPSTLFLNPHMPSINNGEATSIGHNTWLTSVYFSDAGCYTLTAGWPSGHWQITFASGT